ncbi:hypothetical protein MMC28_010429 [Mycoblastus sanguinarius]|nr:hypothetical protein [Mycoblastus sanguinarius]
MINSDYHLTFGLEFECLLAFHESLLQGHTPVKDIPEEVRCQMCQSSQANIARAPKYMGWGLVTPTNYPEGIEEHHFQEFFASHLEKFGYRGYAGEILQLAQTILPPNVSIHDSFAKKYTDFSQWHLTHDRSLVGVDKSTLASQLASQKISVDSIEDWDSHGIELVTRALPYTPASMSEVNTYLSSLLSSGSPNISEVKHTAFATTQCGFHIHVGLPTPPNHQVGTAPPTFTLPTLQHLAYILVMYESAMSQLHPEHRRAGSEVSFTDLQTNLDNFLEEPTYDDDDDSWIDDFISGTSDGSLPSGFDDSPVAPFKFANVRAKIFHPNQTIPGLATLMGSSVKGRIVNWQYIARTNGAARTLEFRQHEGTLSAESVKWWVEFVVGLVRLAELNGRKYGAEGYAGEGYPHVEWNEGLRPEDLFELMGMEDEGRKYFEGRMKSFGA